MGECGGLVIRQSSILSLPRLARSFLSAILCLVAAGALPLTPAAAQPPARTMVAAASVAAPLHAQEKEEGCNQGKRTKAFGWMLVDYGISTMKYVIGLFLIPVGLLLVCVGVIVEVAEAATCG